MSGTFVVEFYKKN